MRGIFNRPKAAFRQPKFQRKPLPPPMAQNPGKMQVSGPRPPKTLGKMQVSSQEVHFAVSEGPFPASETSFPAIPASFPASLGHVPASRAHFLASRDHFAASRAHFPASLSHVAACKGGAGGRGACATG